MLERINRKYALGIALLFMCIFIVYWTNFIQNDAIIYKVLSLAAKDAVVRCNYTALSQHKNGSLDVAHNNPLCEEFSPTINKSTPSHDNKIENASLRTTSPKIERCRVSEYHFIRCPGPIGRLGNMMFQLAGTLGIAHALKYRPIISDTNPMVNFFNLTNVKIVSWAQSEKEIKVPEGEWERGTWSQKHPDYLCHNLSVGGYYQTWKVFNNTPDTVRNAFAVKAEHLEEAKAFLAEKVPQGATIIGFHVRRGDFLDTYKQERGRVVANRTYTTKAMHFYRQRYKNAFFVVCSDDMNWCKENIIGSDVIYSDFKKPISDMAIMSRCDHMIITGGSFGWWGGWLSGGTVVYLSDFPRPGSALAKGNFTVKYYPPHWIGMSNKPSENSNIF